jgi:hypothetical protein
LRDLTNKEKEKDQIEEYITVVQSLASSRRRSRTGEKSIDAMGAFVGSWLIPPNNPAPVIGHGMWMGVWALWYEFHVDTNPHSGRNIMECWSMSDLHSIKREIGWMRLYERAPIEERDLRMAGGVFRQAESFSHCAHSGGIQPRMRSHSIYS